MSELIDVPENLHAKNIVKLSKLTIELYAEILKKLEKECKKEHTNAHPFCIEVEICDGNVFNLKPIRAIIKPICEKLMDAGYTSRIIPRKHICDYDGNCDFYLKITIANKS